ncbi:MAG: TonB-dependent receptor [Desulfobacteraceae bacterium]|jgi:iron complex outermembrane receptor protein
MEKTFDGITEEPAQLNRIRNFASDSLRPFMLIQIMILSLSLLVSTGVPVFAQHHQSNGHSKESEVMEEMVIKADRITEYVENHPRQVEILGQKEISRRNMLSVEEALKSMPGVDVKKSSGVGSRISIRGSGKSGGVLVLLNGRPLNSSQYGATDLSTIPIDIIESITVFKPPIPVWLGPGGSDGAINIITRTSNIKDEKKRHATQVRGTGGSYGLIEGSVSHRNSLDMGNIMATASGSHRDGKRTNSDKDNGTLSLHWDREFTDEKQLEVDGSYYISEHGSTGPVDNPTPDARQDYQKFSLDSRFSGMIDPFKDYAFNIYADSINLTDEAQSGTTSTLDDLKWGIKGENNWSDEENLWALRLNGIMERDDVDHTLSGAHHRVTAGFGAQVDRNFQSLTGTVGLRGDYTSDFDLAPGFSSGVSYNLAKHWLAKVNAGYSVNIPSFGQLYQPSHGSIDQIRGNPDLLEERIWSYDLGIEYRLDKTHLFQITLFRTDTRDPIVYQRGDDLIYQPVNDDKSFRHGLETTIKYGFDNGMTFDFNAIIQTSEICDTGKELPYTPQVKVKGALLYTFVQSGTRVETTIQYSSTQYTEMENISSQQLDDYVTVDAKAIQPFKIKTIAAEWFLSIENILDTDYEIHYGYPDDGLRFTTGLNLNF